MGSLLKLLKELINIYRVADKKSFIAYLKSVFMNLSEIVMTKSLMPADKMMAGRKCVFRLNGKHIFLEGSLFGLAREIYCRKTYFTVPGFQIGENDVVIDLGANAGVFTTLAALRGKKVIAVEAQFRFYKRDKT